MASTKELLSNPASVGVWTVDPGRSTIAFKAKSMWGLAPVKGHFAEFSGDGQITDTQTVFGRIDIKVASVDTKIRKRDNHLRSADFFEVAKFPDISVVVTSAEGIDGDIVDLRAQLTVKGTSAPLPLRTKVAVLDDGAVRVTAEATIDRNDFGVDGNMMGMIPDKVTISGDVVFRHG
ncbi:MAG TPA: YceI family protein [Mycobacterium sp.]|nr:YceI family protein [Mycobacterium sp.]